jgi:hypothetical protein
MHELSENNSVQVNDEAIAGHTYKLSYNFGLHDMRGLKKECKMLET